MRNVERLNEIYNYIIKNKTYLNKDSLFSDGTNMYYWINDNEELNRSLLDSNDIKYACDY